MAQDVTRWYQSSAALGLIAVILSAVMIAANYSDTALWDSIRNVDNETFEFIVEPSLKQNQYAVPSKVSIKMTLRGTGHARKRLRENLRDPKWMDAFVMHVPIHAKELTDRRVKGTISQQKLFDELKDNERLKGLHLVDAAKTKSVSYDFKIGTLVERTLRVKVVREGEPSQGFIEGVITSKPDEIAVWLPEEDAANNAVITTEPVSITNRRATFSTTAHLDMPARWKLANSRDASTFVVDVDVVIKPKRPMVLLDPVEITVPNMPKGYTARVIPNYLAVQVRKARGQKKMGGLRATIDTRKYLLGKNGIPTVGNHKEVPVTLHGGPVALKPTGDGTEVDYDFAPKQVTVIVEKYTPDRGSE